MNTTNIIQSCYLSNDVNTFNIQSNFVSPEFYWMSWALSSLQLQKLYGNITLYSNALGKEMLIDRLKLPYAKVIVNENNYPKKFWSLNKIHTYSLQEKPFLHVDGDVFMWQRLNDNFLNSGLIAQNIEHVDPFYRGMLTELSEKEIALPEILEHVKNITSLKSCNAGIFGGSDIPFFKQYTQLAFSYVEDNIDKLKTIENKDINMFVEQLFFYQLAIKKNKPVNCLIQEEIEDMSYPGIVNFLDVPYQTKFIHMLGNYKISVECCKMLAKRLRLDFPDQYYHLIDELKKNDIKMFMRVYNDQNQPEETASKPSLKWQELYQIERQQKHFYEDAFTSRETFLKSKFITNHIVLSINNLNQEEVQLIESPCSMEAEIKTFEIDELDKLIINLLEQHKSAENLLNDLIDYLDPEVYENEQGALLELLQLKIRRGCEDNIYHVVSGNYNPVAS